jgi:hypothetical protein
MSVPLVTLGRIRHFIRKLIVDECFLLLTIRSLEVRLGA